MNRKQLIRLILDMIMLSLFIIVMAYPVTGNLIHEVVGVLLILLMIVHNGLNWRWYKAITKGKYNLSRAVHTGINLVLVLFIFGVIFSASLVSHTLFAFIHVDLGITARQIHLLAAYWGLIILSVHIGLHWNMLIGIAKKYFFPAKNSAYLLIVFRLGAILLAINGAYVFYQQDILSKLFLWSLYSFWDEEQLSIRLFLDYIAMMGLFIVVSHYGFKYLRSSSYKK